MRRKKKKMCFVSEYASFCCFFFIPLHSKDDF
jgi:hypothetical protein